MVVPADEPSQASRLEAVAEAGMGADDSEHSTARLGDDARAGNEKSPSPSGSSEAAAEDLSKNGIGKDNPEVSQRGKLKTALIMLSLCVRLPKPRFNSTDLGLMDGCSR